MAEFLAGRNNLPLPNPFDWDEVATSIPWWRGRFFCFPYLVLDPAAWFAAMSKLIQQLHDNEHEDAKSLTLRRGLGNYELTIAINNRSSIDINGRDGTIELYSNSAGTERLVSRGEWPNFHARGKTAKAIRNTMKSLFGELGLMFNFAIGRGLVKVEARPRSPLAPFEIIAPDQLKYFSVAGPPDFDRKWWPVLQGDGTEMCDRGGEKIFSVRVMPGEAVASENEIAAIVLAQRLKIDPDLTREQACKWLQNQNHLVGKTERGTDFDAVWNRAHSDNGRSGGKPGRRKKDKTSAPTE